MPAKTARTYRLPDETIRQIAEIAAIQHGLADVHVVIWAVGRLHESVMKTAGKPPKKTAKTN
jgi:hypothetical protein